MNNTEEKEFAESFGFTAVADIKRGKGWHRYVKNDTHVWTCSAGWGVAELINGHYCNHRYYMNLANALEEP